MEQFLLGDLSLWCLDPFEAEVLAGDVESYFDDRLALPSGALIVDAGANIGMFSAKARLRFDARILAFEPIPAIAEVLSRNAATLGGIEVFVHGLGAREELLDFTFFPRMSCLSSSARGPENMAAERARITAACVALIREGRLMQELAMFPDEMLGTLADSFIASRLRGENHEVRIRTLSAVIDERGISVIDLLKIDVEGAELDVLAGIEPRHWPRIRRVVLEVERWAERSSIVRALLEAQRFQVSELQDPVMRSGDYGLIFALQT